MAEYTTVQAVLTALGLTVATVGTGFISAKIRDGETTFNWRVAGSTLLIALVAGGVIVYQGLEVNATTIGVAIGVAVPLVDKLWNTLAPENWGGKSPADYFRQGTGAGTFGGNSEYPDTTRGFEDQDSLSDGNTTETQGSTYDHVPDDDPRSDEDPFYQYDDDSTEESTTDRAPWEDESTDDTTQNQ